MQACAAFDASGMTRMASRRHPLWWGVLGAVTIEATIVAGLIASYFYLMAGAAEWPPEGVDPPELSWPTVNLVLLLASAGTMYWAGWGMDRGSRLICTLGTGASTLLATIVVAIRSLQLAELDVGWTSHAYGSIVWAIMVFHYIHVVSAILGTAVVTWLAAVGYFTRERQLGVVVDTLYWYFVAGAWIPLYLVLYWTPRLV